MKTLLKRRLLNTTRYSTRGLFNAWKSEEAFRIEILFLPFLLPLAFVVGKSKAEVCILVMSLFIVIVTELLNTGLEKTIDRISLEKNHLSAFVRDIGSAAVFISITQALVVWAILITFA